jgi:hypothetical protein
MSGLLPECLSLYLAKLYCSTLISRLLFWWQMVQCFQSWLLNYLHAFSADTFSGSQYTPSGFFLLMSASAICTCRYQQKETGGSTLYMPVICSIGYPCFLCCDIILLAILSSLQALSSYSTTLANIITLVCIWKICMLVWYRIHWTKLEVLLHSKTCNIQNQRREKQEVLIASSIATVFSKLNLLVTLFPFHCRVMWAPLALDMACVR